MIQLTDQPFDPSARLKAFTQTTKGAGGIVSFTGIVRDVSSQGSVKKLYLECYSPLTEKSISNAVASANQRWALMGSSVVHRYGEMHPEDAIVFVATASKHRRDSFEAADFLMDYLKTEAIFWKKETTSNGETWIEPRPDDYKDAARWNAATKEDSWA